MESVLSQRDFAEELWERKILEANIRIWQSWLCPYQPLILDSSPAPRGDQNNWHSQAVRKIMSRTTIFRNVEIDSKNLKNFRDSFKHLNYKSVSSDFLFECCKLNNF